MDLDILLLNFFGTTDLDALDAARIAEGRERLELAFATERDPGRRFALWAILHGLGDPPEPAAAFEDRDEREAAEAYARAMARLG